MRIRGDLVVLVALLAGSAYAVATQVGTDPVGQSLAARKPPALRTGARYPGFELPDVTGVPRALAKWKGEKATVLYFWMVECPCIDAVEMRVKTLMDKYRDAGVSWVAVDSHPDDTPAQVLDKMVDVHADYRVVLDRKEEVSTRLGAPGAVTFVVLDAEMRIRYRGELDDDLLKPKKPFLDEAIAAVLAGRDPSPAETGLAGDAVRVIEAAQAEASAAHPGMPHAEAPPEPAPPSPLDDQHVRAVTEKPANPRRGWWQRLTQS